MPEDDIELKNIVSVVQRHKHTPSCLKYDGVCRYGFPRLPSPRTLLAEPIDPELDEKEKTKKNRNNMRNKKLKKKQKRNRKKKK